MSRLRSVFGATAVAGAVLVAGTGCSVGLESLPLPAPGGGSHGYTVHATFANALNLPAKAKVRLSGADVGEVSSTAVRDYAADVSLRIQRGVILPVGTRAELRTATPLGDVFVGLEPPPDTDPAAPVLHDGDRIPLQSTAAAATIEEVLTTASLLVNGGAIRNLTTVVNGLGRAVGDRGDRIGTLLDQSNQLVRTLAARSDQIRTALEETNQLVGQLSAQQGTIDDAISAAGPALKVLNDNARQALSLVRQVDDISRQLAKFPAIGQGAAVGLIDDINRISAELTAAATDPNASLAAVNDLFGPVIKLTDSTAAHANADWQDLSLGAVPDPGHPGDPVSHLPNAVDWQNFVGTLAYTLLKLQATVTGPGR